MVMERSADIAYLEHSRGRLAQRVQAGSALGAATLAFLGAWLISAYPGTSAQWIAIGLLPLAALLLLSGFQILRHGTAKPGSRRAEWISILMVIGFLLIVGFSALGPPMRDPTLSAFRPIFAFGPLLFLALFLLDPSRRCLARVWGVHGLQMLLVLSGAGFFAGFDLQRDGMTGLLVWLVVGNSIAIRLLQNLLEYAENYRLATELVANSDAVRKSEERLRRLLDDMGVGAWSWSFETPGRGWLSRHCKALLGIEPAEVRDIPEWLARLTHPEDYAVALENANQQIEQGDRFEVVSRLRTADRGYRWFRSLGGVRRDASGAVIEVVAALSDIHREVEASEAARQRQALLETMAYRDALTGLYNRRYALSELQTQLSRLNGQGGVLSVALADVDHFKAYNDQYGHAAGDEALQAVAAVLETGAQRSGDSVARFGGEELLMILPGSDARGALEVARAVCARLREAAIPHCKSDAGMLTLSIGVTTVSGGDDPVPDLALMLEEADAALYRVKQQGRDGARHYIDRINDEGSATAPGGG